ncbi:gamma-glutamyltransferase family protein [Streptomyces tricolor]|nr:gamma-glutamyltransferase family protein [Streptomyces tricolor]
MAWLDEGLPNTLTPGRRPAPPLTPSLALRDGVPVMAFGTPGGDQQDQWQLHFFLAAALRAPSAAASISRAPSTRPTGTTTASPAPSTRAGGAPAA